MIDQANDAQISAKQVQDILLAVNNLRHVVFANSIKEILETHYQIQQAEAALAKVDLSDFSALEDEFSVLKTKGDELDQQIQLLDGTTGRIEQQLKDSERQCKKLSDQQEETSDIADSKEDNLRKIVSVWPEFDSEARLKDADEEAATSPADSIENHRKSVYSEMNSKVHEIERNIADHNQTC